MRHQQEFSLFAHLIYVLLQHTCMLRRRKDRHIFMGVTPHSSPMFLLVLSLTGEWLA
jgi:hypothetical protein